MVINKLLLTVKCVLERSRPQTRLNILNPFLECVYESCLPVHIAIRFLVSEITWTVRQRVGFGFRTYTRDPRYVIQGIQGTSRLCTILRYNSAYQNKEKIQMDVMWPDTRCNTLLFCFLQNRFYPKNNLAI